MPRFKTINDDGDKVERYRWPAGYVTPTPDIAPALREWRREAIKDQEEFLAFQKANASDRTFFKDCARRALRLQRAITLALPYFGDPDSGQVQVRTGLWPLELADECDDVGRRILLAFG